MKPSLSRSAAGASTVLDAPTVEIPRPSLSLAAPGPQQTLPGLSVVLPCFNEEANVAAAIDDARRVAARVADVHEVVVVDDGSSDATRDIALSPAHRHHGLRAISHQRNRG